MEQPQQHLKLPGKKPNKKLISGGIISALLLFGIVTAKPTPETTTTSSQAQSTTATIPANSDTTTQTTTASPAPAASPLTPANTPPTQPVVAPTPAPAAAAKSCGSGYYLNVDGNCIQSPTSAPSAPVGATGICNDGTYTFAVHHQGACSHHGGVASWL